MSASADDLHRRGDLNRRHHHRQQVLDPLERQASLQPHQLRPGGGDPSDRRGLGLPRTMGQRSLPRLLVRLSGRAGGEPFFSERRHLRFSWFLSRHSLRPFHLARRADGHSSSPAAERSASPLRFLHDLRSQDHPRLASRKDSLRLARCLGGGIRSIPSVPDQWIALVSGLMRDVRSDHRPAAAGNPVPMAAPGDYAGRPL